jgi:hypothetical protein
MAWEMKAILLSDTDLKDPKYKLASLEPIDAAALLNMTLPPSCSTGHGWCENGVCYVCCNGWKRLMDGNRHLTCREARDGHYTYQCNGNTWQSSC